MILCLRACMTVSSLTLFEIHCSVDGSLTLANVKSEVTKTIKGWEQSNRFTLRRLSMSSQTYVDDSWRILLSSAPTKSHPPGPLGLAKFLRNPLAAGEALPVILTVTFNFTYVGENEIGWEGGRRETTADRARRSVEKVRNPRRRCGG